MESLERSENSRTRKQSLVEFSSVSYSYSKKDEPAVNDLSFNLYKSEITALLGPNGSGKSTAFKILSTQIAAQSGEVDFLGKSIKSSPRYFRENLGVCFQDASLDPWLTVEENLYTHTVLFGLNKEAVRVRVDEYISAFGLFNKSKELTKNLSGGQKRKVEIIKALLPSPKLLVLDEPTTGLDISSRREFWKQLKEIQGKTSIIVSTHLMDEADMCDRVLIMSKGSIKAQGSPHELKTALNASYCVIKCSDDEYAQVLSLKIEKEHELKADISKSDLRLKLTPLKDRKNLFNTLESDSKIDSLSFQKASLEDVYYSATGEELSS